MTRPGSHRPRRPWAWAIARGGHEATYDTEGAGRILTASVNGAQVARYTYDPFGRRFSKTPSGGTAAFFLHDGQGGEIAVYDGASATGAWTLSRKLFHDPGQVAVMRVRELQLRAMGRPSLEPTAELLHKSVFAIDFVDEKPNSATNLVFGNIGLHPSNQI